MTKPNQAKRTTPITEHNLGAHDKKSNVSETTGTNARGPKNYKPVDDDRFDVAGFWRPEAGAIHGMLVGGYEFIQKSGVNEGDVSRVLVVKLLQPCVARVKLEGGGLEDTELSTGEFCGVFYTAGLRELLSYAGCKVYVQRNAEKKKTRRGAMWTYTMRYDGTKKPLVIRPPFKGAEEDASFDPSAFGDATEIS